jgi:lysophospholipase L1-like esterase
MNTRKLILGLLLFQLRIVSYAQSPVTNQRLFDTIPFLPEHYQSKVARFESEPAIPGSIVFLGNSITEGGQWHELTGNSNIINRGIGGDITFGVLQRVDEVIRHKPSKVFILIGINDIGKDIPDAVIADNCRKIILRLQKGSPETRIYLQSILPLNPDVRGFPQHYDKQSHVVNTNKLLANVARSTTVTFLDLHALFLDADQNLDEKFTADGLHLNESAYKKWVAFLKKTRAL